MRLNVFPIFAAAGFTAVLLLAGCAVQQKPAVEKPAATAATPSPAPPATRTNVWTREWTSLFDGKTLTNWAVTDFAGHGEVGAEPGQIKINMGADLSGITWTNGTLPRTDYEISLEANKLQGNDFFCGLTFPVGDSFCSLILGGWGGAVVGLSSLDDLDASENDTSKNFYFERNRWFRIRVQVTREHIAAWLDDDPIIDAKLANRRVSLRVGDIEKSAPLGVATYMTMSAVRNIRLRLLEK
jgi:hypothetical protein